MPRYTFTNSPRRPSSLLRILIIWGLPLLAWVLLIVGILYFTGSKEETPTETPPPPATQAPAEQPAQPPAAPATQAPATPAPQTPAAQTPTSRHTFANAPYALDGAVSFIGLPHESECGTGILVDPATRKILWAKNADRAVPIASMTKMMTLLLAEEAIASGKVHRDTVIRVTEAAYRIGGSQVWLDPRESFPLQELLKAVAIKSANDAAYLVGEYLGNGDIGAFVKRMNTRAKDLGMSNTTFYDAHGLGDGAKRDNVSSARDMAILAEQLLSYPEVMRLASTPMDRFRDGKTELKNHNNLVFKRVPGVDGLKTGYTKNAGFCVTVTCERGGRRLIGCVTGFKDVKARDAFCKALLDWGYTK